MASSFDQQYWIAVMNSDENSYFREMGRRIAKARKELGLTQVQLAETLDIAQQTYACYEIGSRRIPVSLLPTLAQALAMETDVLLGATTKAQAKRGPAPKLLQQMERIQRLPKAQQRFVMQMIDTVLQQAAR